MDDLKKKAHRLIELGNKSLFDLQRIRDAAGLAPSEDPSALLILLRHQITKQIVDAEFPPGKNSG